MKRILVLLGVCLWAGFAAAEVPLEQAVEKGLERASNYRNQLLEQKSLALETQTARKNRLFSIDAKGSYLFKSSRMEVGFTPGQTFETGAKHNYDLNVSVKQPIYLGNILVNAVKLAESQQTLGQYRELLEKLDVTGRVKTSYFNYRLLLHKKKSLGTLIHRLNLHLEQLEDYFNEDLVRKTDLLETQRKIQEQEINLEELNNLIAKEKIQFEKLCGMDINEVERGFSEKAASYDAALEMFKREHPLLKTLAEQEVLLNTRGDMVKGEYRPQVTAFGEFHYGKPGLDFFQDEWMLYFQGGVSVGMKLFDWDKKKRALTILDYQKEKVNNERDEFIRETKKNLEQLYATRDSIGKKMAILGNMLRLAEEDARLKEELYREQQVSNIDYLDALTTRERYESMRNELTMRHELVKVNINLVIGKSI